MIDWPILSIVTFLPLVGVALILLIRGDDELARRNIRNIALFTTIVTFAVSLFIWGGFDPSNPGFQMVEEAEWLGGLVTYKMGVDGISMLFVILTTFLMPLCILASAAITERLKEYMIAFLVLETLMIGVFCALDIVVFYIFFEGGLIPMFIIIGVWGGKRRIYASFKFFLYTLAGLVSHASRHHGDVLERGHNGHRAASRTRFPVADGVLAVAGLLCLVRGEDADVAFPHLAA
jgi:NADH-quinone oxidoreductase subunit M